MLKNWKVVYVKPNTEKKVAEACQRAGIGYYLPAVERTRIVQRRKVKGLFPLFRGYVFARITPENRLPLLRTNAILRTIEPRTSVGLLRELVLVRRMLRQDPVLEVMSEIPKIGETVRIKEGAMMGTLGKVIRADDRTRIVVRLEMLGQVVAMTIDSEILESV